MDGVLPFEYGYFYKIISNPNHEELSIFLNKTPQTGYITSYDSYGAFSGNYANYGIDETKFYHPIGYIESEKKVVLEVVVEEKETTRGYLVMNGMSFSTSSMEKTYKKISRVECEVNAFIRNFEKIL